jgi:hypothetical protein
MGETEEADAEQSQFHQWSLVKPLSPISMSPSNTGYSLLECSCEFQSHFGW